MTLVLVEGSNKLAGIKREHNKARVIDAYDRYARHERGSMDELLRVVRQFVVVKLKHLELNNSGFAGVGSAEDIEDWVQKATFSIYQHLNEGKFKGDSGEKFYAWINKVCFNEATNFFKDLLHHKKNRVPLMVTNEDDEGDTFEEDNVEALRTAVRVEDRRFISARIPHEVQGIDRMICLLLLTRTSDGEGNVRGRTYAEIGKALRISEGAVKMRLSRLKAKYNPESNRGTSDV